MRLEKFEACNDLEHDISRSKRGRMPIEELTSSLVRSVLFISSKSEVQQDGSGFDPLLLEEGGAPLVAAFSSLERPGLHSAVARYILQMQGRDFFLRLPPKFGVIVNPGYDTQLVITPDAAANLKKRLMARP